MKPKIFMLASFGQLGSSFGLSVAENYEKARFTSSQAFLRTYFVVFFLSKKIIEIEKL